MNFDGEIIIKYIVVIALGYAVALFTLKHGFLKSRRTRFFDLLLHSNSDMTNDSRGMFYGIWIGLFLIILFTCSDMPYFIAFSIGTMICVIQTAIHDFKYYLDKKDRY